MKARLDWQLLRFAANTASVTPRITNGRASIRCVPASELKRIKDLEAENCKLKRMYAELALENAAIKDVLSRKF